MQSFQHIFRREGIKAQVVEGDSFHRFNRMEMRANMKEAEAKGNKHYSHFGPYSNLLEELEALFKGYGDNGSGRVRKYIHDGLIKTRKTRLIYYPKKNYMTATGYWI